jgi:protein-S-isoprenylcysteine O-methyltransferase Ste14
MEVIGRTTIHPAVFYSGKLSGYLTWILLGLDYLGLHVLTGVQTNALGYASYVLLGLAAAFIVFSLVNLGKSTRLGLPTVQTELKTHGIYRISRNPMYVGFDLLTLSAVLKLGHWLLLVLGAYSIVVYHLIILGEEAYLASAFGEAYAQYKSRVRRYL